MRRIVLFELNEVPFRIIDSFCSRRPRSHLARLLGRCAQFETHAEDEGKLQPWKTWPSLHRGVPNGLHGLSHLGQDTTGVDARYPPIWTMLARAGLRAGVFGSMHSHPVPPDPGRYAFYFPDTFASSSETHPTSLEPMQALNLALTRASGSNVSTRVPVREALELAPRAPALGLRAATIRDLAVQVVSERIVRDRRGRRRTFQAVILFDAFMKQLLEHRPDFSTFFSNHVAATMHRYWLASFPGDLEDADVDAAWIRRFENEIPFAMDRFDRFLGRLVRFVDAAPDTVLCIASSMGQAAIPPTTIESRLVLRDTEAFTRAFGLGPGDWEQRPAMDPTINLVVRPERVDDFRLGLRSASIAGKAVYYLERDGGFFNMVFGQREISDREPVVEIFGAKRTPRELGLVALESEDGSGGTAYHIPEGILLVYDPRRPDPPDSRRAVSTLDVAPALLANFGLPIPPYMRQKPSFEMFSRT